MENRKKDFCHLAAFILLLFVFYPDLFFAKAASLMGDHIEQHYPWTSLLAESIRNFRLPWWTDLIHCGFPIAAESQIGVFYLPNWILYFFLPLRTAYAYINVLHFFIAGWATYLYGRMMKLGALASFVAAFIFLFGAAYGGAYYNITSLKTICWLPLAFYFFENYYQQNRRGYLAALAVIIGMSLVAGYLQVAILTWFVFLITVLCRLSYFSTVRPSPRTFWYHLAALSLTLLGAFALALPQILLTLELSLRSNRMGLEEGYAYVGSLSPFALATFIDPLAQRIFRGNSLYLGLFSVFLFLIPFFSAKTRKDYRFGLWTALTVVSLLMALGRWSPVYVAFVKLTKFYSFRTPSKFLVFVCFGLSLLAGLGLDRLMAAGRAREETSRSALKAARFYLVLLGGFIASGGLAYYFMTAGKKWTMIAGEWFIRKFIYGQPGRPHSLEAYLDRLSQFPESVLSLFSFQEWANVWTLAMIVISGLFFAYFLKVKNLSRGWLTAGLIFLTLDLYGYAWFDIKRDFASYDDVLKPSPVVQTLALEQKKGEVGRLYVFRRPGEELPLVPSMNMLYGIEDIGAYSPFVMKRYHETIGLFGNVNDSNLAFSPAPQFVKEHLGLLNILDVSHILSKYRMEHHDLQLLMHDEKSQTFLYRNQGDHVRAFFVSKVETFSSWEELKARLLQPGFNPREALLLEESEWRKVAPQKINSFGKPNVTLNRIQHTSGSELWTVNVDRPGFFVLANTTYPGWTATLDGKPVPLLNAYGLFQAVAIAKAGEYQIQFHYSPFPSGLAGGVKKILGR